jgi:protein gp37
VKVLTNFYSTPLSVGTRVTAKVYSAYVEVWHEGHCVARHERCYPNVWLKVSVENKKQGLPRIDVLRGIPAVVRFLIDPAQKRYNTVPHSFRVFAE